MDVVWQLNGQGDKNNNNTGVSTVVADNCNICENVAISHHCSKHNHNVN